MTTSNKFILKKCKKNYQGSDKFLFIVLYGERKDTTLARLNSKIQDDKSVKYRDNIKVISLEQFMDILGFSKEQIEQLDDIAQMADIAADSPLELEKLIELYVENLKELDEITKKYPGWSYLNNYLGREH